MKIKQLLKFITGKIIVFTLGLTIFFGITSTFADWPQAPSGENIGGWLGEFFDLNNSNADKLIISSKYSSTLVSLFIIL